MLIGYPIGCFTHVECRESLITTPYAGHFPIWVLVAESNEAASYVLSRVSPDTNGFQLLDQAFEDGLLHELHAGWLDRNDPWGFQRFRYGYDPHGSFRIGFEEGNTTHPLVIRGRGKRIFQEWKDALQTGGPFDLIILLVTEKSISGGPRSVPRGELTVRDLSIEFGENITPQE